MSALIVYGGWDYPGVADFSPFCLKVKTYLRMIGVPYATKLGDPRKAPTGKIPYIDDGGTLVGDSTLILEHLKKKHGDKLDAKLTPEQRAIGHLVRRTLEESLYFSVLAMRWLQDENWGEIAKMLKPLMPPVIGGVIMNGPIRGTVRKQAQLQGIGRHKKENIDAFAREDVDAVAEILGKKTYLLGEEPSSYDAMAYGFLANGIAFPPKGTVAARIKERANLAAYVDRMAKKYWETPDAKA